MIKKIVIGTNNQHKAREIREILDGLPVELLTLEEFENIEPVPEDAHTLGENAALKALGFARQTGLPTVADDSGLEVDALDGRPGVHSARYAGPDATYQQLCEKLLGELKDAPEDKRSARFRCCVCMADSEGVKLEVDGAVEGRIIFEMKGDEGFGYDPVFVPIGYNSTFAQMSPEMKNSISHRGVAFRRFRDKLKELLEKGYGSTNV